VSEGGDTGRPITVAEPDGEVARVFHTIAERLDGDLAPRRVDNPELRIT
jgi:hypothetical protein